MTRRGFVYSTMLTGLVAAFGWELDAQEGGECSNPPPPCTVDCGGGVETVHEFYYGVPATLVAASQADRDSAAPTAHGWPTDDRA